MRIATLILILLSALPLSAHEQETWELKEPLDKQAYSKLISSLIQKKNWTQTAQQWAQQLATTIPPNWENRHYHPTPEAQKYENAWRQRLYTARLLYLLDNHCFGTFGYLDAIKKINKEQLSEEQYAEVRFESVERFVPEKSLIQTLQHPDIVQSLARNTTNYDLMGAALKVLADLQEKYPECLRDYPDMAVALALVYDDPSRIEYWPHHQVPSSCVPKNEETPWLPLASYFIPLNKSAKSFYPLDQLDVEELKFLIDAPIKTSELEWAESHVRPGKDRVEDLYASIRYNVGRLSSRSLDWPEDTPYQLENILTQGGICVDQAYYSTIVAKACGIPSLFFTGQGKRGGHAWFGFLENSDQWKMDVGRYKESKFVTGNAIDPQTLQRITDHQIETLTQRITRTDRYLASRDLELLASLLSPDDHETRIALLRSSIRHCDANLSAWEKLTESFIPEQHASEMKTHLNEMSKRFRKDIDVQAYTTRKLAALARLEGNERSARKVEDKFATAYNSQRHDLALPMKTGQLISDIQSGNLKDFEKNFKTCIRLFGRDGGGDLVLKLILPSITTLVEKGEPGLAQEMLVYAKKKMEVSPRKLLVYDQFQAMESLILSGKYKAMKQEE